MAEETNTGNPESLHSKGQDIGVKTEGTFVNPGTPEGALVVESDLPSPLLSDKGTADLRNNLIK